MWNVAGTDLGNWLELRPATVLYGYDGPRIFTCQDSESNLYLAYFCDEDSATARFLVVAFREDLLDALTKGKINVRDALSQPQAWLFDLDNDCKTVHSWRVDVDKLPDDVLPQPGVMLWKHLAPVA